MTYLSSAGRTADTELTLHDGRSCLPAFTWALPLKVVGSESSSASTTARDSVRFTSRSSGSGTNGSSVSLMTTICGCVRVDSAPQQGFLSAGRWIRHAHPEVNPQVRGGNHAIAISYAYDQVHALAGTTK